MAPIAKHLIDRLPAAAQAKLSVLERHRQDGIDAISDGHRRLIDLRKPLVRLQQERAVLAEQLGGRLPKSREAITLDAIEKKQRRIRELIADIRQTDAAPYPNEASKRLAHAKIEQLAGRPDIRPIAVELERLDDVDLRRRSFRQRLEYRIFSK
jgi:hypothetical protein